MRMGINRQPKADSLAPPHLQKAYEQTTAASPRTRDQRNTKRVFMIGSFWLARRQRPVAGTAASLPLHSPIPHTTPPHPTVNSIRPTHLHLRQTFLRAARVLVL